MSSQVIIYTVTNWNYSSNYAVELVVT